MKGVVGEAAQDLRSADPEIVAGVDGEGIGKGRFGQTGLWAVVAKGHAVVARQGAGAEPHIARRVLGNAVAGVDRGLQAGSLKRAQVFGAQIAEDVVLIVADVVLAAEPDAAVAVLGNKGDAIVGNAVVAAKAVEAAAVVVADPAVARAKPQAVLAVAVGGEHLIATKSVGGGEDVELVAVKTANAAIRGGNPQVAVGVLGEMFDVDSGQTFGQRVGAPDAVGSG